VYELLTGGHYPAFKRFVNVILRGQHSTYAGTLAYDMTRSKPV